MRRRDKYLRWGMLGGCLLLSFWLWISNRQKDPVQEQCEAIVDSIDRGVMQPGRAAKYLRKLNTDFYPLLIAELESQDSFFHTSYISVYPNLPIFLQSRLNQPYSAADRQLRAKSVLEMVMEADPSVIEVVHLLDHELPAVRAAACEALYFRSYKEEGWPQHELVAKVNSRDPVVRDFVLYAFQRIGEKSRISETNFTRFLRYTDEWVVLDAVEVIARTGGNLTPAKVALQKLLKSSSKEVTFLAASRLSKMDKANAESVAALLDIAQSTNSEFRASALSYLSLLGTNAAIHSPAVKKLFTDTDAEVRQAATNAYYIITPGMENESWSITFHHLMNTSRYTRVHMKPMINF